MGEDQETRLLSCSVSGPQHQDAAVVQPKNTIPPPTYLCVTATQQPSIISFVCAPQESTYAQGL